ncbi:hypothetical protein BJX64DRAFT_205516 [Aspergillus heterothallicus]
MTYSGNSAIPVKDQIVPAADSSPTPPPNPSVATLCPDNLVVKYCILPISRHPLKSCFTLFVLQFLLYRACTNSYPDGFCLRRVGDSMTAAYVLLLLGILYTTWLRRRAAQRKAGEEAEREKT